jgi:cell volume regulation protein A
MNLSLGATGLLVFVSVLAGLYSARAGLSFLLVFLVVGMLAGQDGPGGIDFNDVNLSLWVGSAGLGVILLDGGLRTRLSTFRTGLKPAAWLATVGVVVTAALTGVAASLALGLPPLLGLLAGAIVGSTDAAAVFALLKSSGLRVSERLSSTLEIESGLNDPMAVFMVLALSAALLRPEEASLSGMLWTFAQQALLGTLIGVLAGMAVGALLLRLPLGGAAEGLTALLLLAAGIGVFGGAGWAGGSGFLAVYLFGLVVAHRAQAVVERSLAGMDGFAWLAQALMFLLLGLLVTPSRLLDNWLPTLAVALVLMFVARPVAVALCLKPLHFSWREVGFISWVGLRGAVPVVLALIPLMLAVPQARVLFDVAFVAVLASLVLQGATMVWAARLFDVNLPDAQDEPAVRVVFGDFALDADAPVRDICGFYGLPDPAHDGSVAQWMARELRRPPVAGDGIDWGHAHFAVREMDGARMARVGLLLYHTPEDEGGGGDA